MNNSNRNHLVDLLRFLAALWVAFYHFNQSIPYIDNWYRNFLKLGYLGVPVFFVISGYCVTLSAYHSKNWKDFIIRRVFRIFPPYYFSLIVVLLSIFILRLLAGHNSVATLPKSASSIFLSLTLLTKPFSNFEGINWVYWSLTCEIFYYIVVCMALLIHSKFQLLFFILISLLAIIVPIHTEGPLFILKNWPPFAIGASVYFIQQQKNAASWLLLFVSIAALIKNFMLHNEMPYVIATIIATALIAVSLLYKLKNNLFSKFGDYSYSVYLLHVPLGVFLIGYYKTQAIQQSILLNIAFDTATCLVVFAAAYLSYKFIELPSVNAGKLFSQKITGQKARLVKQDYYNDPKNH